MAGTLPWKPSNAATQQQASKWFGSTHLYTQVVGRQHKTKKETKKSLSHTCDWQKKRKEKKKSDCCFIDKLRARNKWKPQWAGKWATETTKRNTVVQHNICNPTRKVVRRKDIGRKNPKYHAPQTQIGILKENMPGKSTTELRAL